MTEKSIYKKWLKAKKDKTGMIAYPLPKRKRKKSKGRGWHYHPNEHALASKGIRTKNKNSLKSYGKNKEVKVWKEIHEDVSNPWILEKMYEQIPDSFEINDDTTAVLVIKDDDEITQIREFGDSWEVKYIGKGNYANEYGREKARKFMNRSKGKKRNVVDDYEYYIFIINEGKATLFKFHYSWIASQRLYGLTNNEAIRCALNNDITVEEANEMWKEYL